MTYFKFSQATLLSTSIFIMGATPSIAMEDDKTLHSLIPSKQIPAVINSPSSVHPDIYEYEEERSYGHLSNRVDELPNEILYTVLYFLDKSSLGRLSCVNRRFYQVTSDNNLWAQRLTKDKLIPLLGRAWDTYPSQILSYKSYYAVLHLLQDLPKGGEESIERHLRLAILPNSIFSHQCLGLLYEMLGQEAKAFKCFYKAGVLGDELSQKLIVDNLYECHELAEDRYQKLLSLAEKGWKEAQNEVVEALVSPKFGWNETHDELRYQRLVSCAKRGWGKRGGWGSASIYIRVPDVFFRVVCALYEGKFGCNKRPGEERYQELLSLAEEGWESAQEKVVQALICGKLGQDKISKEEKYQKLLSLAERGWYEAQKGVGKALVVGDFGPDTNSEEERYQQLVFFGERGWESIQYEIVYEILKWGKLGWGKKPEEERYQELFSFAERGWKRAQERIFDEICRRSNYDIDKRDEKEKYEELVSCAERGWGNARTDIARLLYEGKLNWAKISEEKRYEQLAFFAEKGWGDRRYVIYALKGGTHGCGKMPLEERYHALVSLAERGDKDAQYSVSNAVSRGDFGWAKVPIAERYQILLTFAERKWFLVDRDIVDVLSNNNWQDKKTEEERCQELVSLGERGLESAQSQVISDIEKGKFGWHKKSEKEQYEALVFLAEKGWKKARDKVCNAHKFNMLGGYGAIQGWTSIQDGSYSGRSEKSRSSPPGYFKKYKNAKYFQLFRTLVEGKLKAKERIIEP